MDNKEKILLNSLNLFAARGYANVGVQEIADSVGVGKPTLYYYFKNKEGLLNEILKINFEKLMKDLADISKYQGDITKNLSHIVNLFFNFAKNNLDFYRLQLSMSFDPSDSITFKITNPYQLKIFNIITALFENASKDHGNMKGRSQQYAITFIGTINSYINLILNHHLGINDELIYRVVHQYMHGIFS